MEEENFPESSSDLGPVDFSFWELMSYAAKVALTKDLRKVGPPCVLCIRHITVTGHVQDCVWCLVFVYLVNIP